MNNKDEEYWIVPKEKPKFEEFVDFPDGIEKETLEDALRWLRQGDGPGKYKVIVTQKSKRTKCCGKLIKRGETIREYLK